MKPVVRLAGGIAAIALALAGCAGSPSGPTPRAGSSDEYTPAGSTAKWLQARRDAGIADCPKSDATVAARADGLPDVTLECMGADSRVRLAGLRGRPMVINVWAQWCGPCRYESPFLAEYSKAAGGKVLMLGIDYVDPRPDYAIEFAKLVGWKYPQIVDQGRAIGPALRIAGAPMTFFVDAEGVVVHRHVGAFGSTQQIKDLTARYLRVKV